MARARARLARRIVRERTRLGVLQKHLAWKAGVTVETLSRIECGRVSASAESIEKIERALAQYATAVSRSGG